MPYSPASSTSQRQLYSHLAFKFPIWLTSKSKCWKNRKCKRLSGLNCPDYYVLFLRDACFDVLSFSYVPLILVESYLLFSKKRSLMIASLLLKNTLTGFKLIIAAKYCHPRSQNEVRTQICRKTKDCRQHFIVTYVRRALKVGRLNVTGKLLKVQT